jgi:predicted alpha/beta-fold hydrolase
MPVLAVPDYRPPFPFTSGHVQTLYPTLFRVVPGTSPVRERLEIPDGDFIDIDWHRAEGTKGEKLVVVSHGLEGNSRKKYPLGLAFHLNSLGWDVICLNFRGCSGEPNRLPRFYHSGVTDDLHTVLTHGLKVGKYSTAALVGFSMGGNQTLKYLGENPTKVPDEVVGAVVFSVPCDLGGSARSLGQLQNRLYMHYFMRGLRQKIRIKSKSFPDLIDTCGLDGLRTFIPFDDRYTAPLHGFRDAEDYYARCSCGQFLGDIKVPALLVQAEDDPFLPASCYPYKDAERNPYLHLEIPRYGGHVGFVRPGNGNLYWSEQRAGTFLEALL